MKLITINELVAVIRLVPNGITKEGKFRFSIIIAIDSINDDYKELSFECLMEVAEKINTLLTPKHFDSNFGIYFKTDINTFQLEKTAYDLEGSPFDVLQGGNYWSKFFSNPEAKIVINKFKTPDDFTHPDNPFEFVYNDSIECCDPCNEESRMPKCDTRDDLLNRIDHADRFFEKVESFYDRSYKNKKERFKKSIDLSDGTTFLFSDILSQLYQHSKLNNETYGVRLDLEISIENLNLFNNAKGKLILTKKDGNNSFLTPEDPNDGNLIFDEKEECILSIYEEYTINRQEIIGQLLPKYYHGRSDYGIVSLQLPKGPNDIDNRLIERFEWKFLSKIQDWNNQLATTSEGLDKENAEKIEGIILYHNLSTDEFKSIFQEIGVNGHEIVCQVTDKNNSSYIGSLCERQVTYVLNQNSDKGPFQDRASIKIDASVIMGDQLDLKNNEVFKWKGYNLCVPKSDVKLEKHENPRNELDNIEDYTRDYDEFEDFFEAHGFTYGHEFINDSNIYLDDLSHLPNLETKKYTFYILKCDAVTDYRIPIGNLKDPNDSPILDIATLIREGLLENRLQIPFKDLNSDSSEFSITPKNSPLYPVQILDKIEHSGEILQDIEKNNRLVLNENNATVGSERFIIPDGISYHFGQLLGLTSNSFIQATNRHDYLKKAFSVFKRAQIKIPKVYFEDTIKYLPDFRNTHIIIKPDDWKSWIRLYDGNFPSDFKSIFLYGNTFEDFFDSLKPYSIKLQSSESLSPNSLELYFNNGIVCRIPMYSILNLRLYSASKDIRDIAYFKNYEEISFINVKEKVETPTIINYLKPIEAKRCLPDKDNDTFSFFSFKVNEDPRRDYLTLLTKSKELIDNSYSDPELDNLFETNFTNEYSRAIFSKVVGNLETNETKEVFPNKFGLSYEFSTPFENEVNRKLASLNYDWLSMTIFELNINLGFSLKLLIRNDGERVNILQIKKGNSEITQNWPYHKSSFILDYNLTKDGLHCKICYERFNNFGKLETGEIFNSLVDKKSLPSISMNEDNISMSSEIEETLINKITDKTDFFLTFNKFESHNNWYRKIKNKEAEYFVYRNEEDNKFKTLTFKLKSYSKFKKYYPQTNNYPWRKFIAIGDEDFSAIIPNNKKPQTPVFNFTPLFYKKQSGESMTTENPICIRINRPQSEDLIAIVDAEYETDSGKFITTQNTSSIARDITKSVDGKTQEDNTLRNYLKSLNPVFNNEYYQGEIEIKAENSLFRLLLFKPHYNFKEKKYQFILPFDYTKFGKLDDPMAKFILTRIQQQSILKLESNNPDDIKTSKFSNAKFIPIRSQRIVSINELHSTKHEVSIKKNGDISNINENSIFIICYFKPRKKGFEDFERELIQVKKEQSYEVVDYILVNDRILKEKYIIEAVNSNEQIGSISVFEIEKHNDNEKTILDMESGKFNFNNNPFLRMIYAESISLKSEDKFQLNI